MVDVIFRDVDPEKLPQFAALLAPAAPQLLDGPAWTPELAERLLRDLAASSANLVRELVRHDGRVAADVLRASGEATLRGLTGPITKAVARLARSGRLPEGLPPPVHTQYDPDVRQAQRARAFVMPAEVRAAFAEAVARVDG